MVNYVEYITLDNEYVDALYSLGYNWNNYELSIKWKLPLNTTGTGYIFHWEGKAVTLQLMNNGVWFYETAYDNGHSYGTTTPFIVKEAYTPDEDKWNLRLDVSGVAGRIGGTSDEKYNGCGWLSGSKRKWGKLLLGSPDNTFSVKIGEVKLKVDGVLVLDMKPCLDEQGMQCFYDVVRNIYIYPYGKGPSDSMIRTVVLTGDWQELPVNDGIDVSKLRDRITPNDKVVDGYAALYDSLCITAGQYNGCPVLISDYTENNQENNEYRKDYIELLPKGRIELPRDRAIQALNRPMVKGNAGDIVRVAVR